MQPVMSYRHTMWLDKHKQVEYYLSINIATPYGNMRFYIKANNSLRHKPEFSTRIEKYKAIKIIAYREVPLTIRS